MPKNPDRQPTWTALVLRALVEADDFLSMDDVCFFSGTTRNQASASLHHLSARHAVESIVGGDGKLWWFATPSEDDRTKIVEERVREPEGNRVRRSKVVKP